MKGQSKHESHAVRNREFAGEQRPRLAREGGMLVEISKVSALPMLPVKGWAEAAL